MRKEIRKNIKVSPNVKIRVQRLIEEITIKKKETENQVIEKLLNLYEQKHAPSKKPNPIKQMIKEDFKIIK